MTNHTDGLDAAGVARTALHEAKTLLSDLALGKSIHNGRFPDNKIEGPLWDRIGDVVKRCEAAIEATRRSALVDAPAGEAEALAYKFQNIMAQELTTDEDGEILGVGPASFEMARLALASPTPSVAVLQADLKDALENVERYVAVAREEMERAQALQAENERLRQALDEWKKSHANAVEGFALVCEEVGVQFDAPEAVAYAINTKIHNAEAARDSAVRDMEEAAERFYVFRELMKRAMDTSPAGESAEAFITRWTDAMEAVADTFDAATPSGVKSQ